MARRRDPRLATGNVGNNVPRNVTTPGLSRGPLPRSQPVPAQRAPVRAADVGAQKRAGQHASEKGVTVGDAKDAWPAGPSRPVVERVVREATPRSQVGGLWPWLVKRIIVVLTSTRDRIQSLGPAAVSAGSTPGATEHPDADLIWTELLMALSERGKPLQVPDGVVVSAPLLALSTDGIVVSPECFHVSKTSMRLLQSAAKNAGTWERAAKAAAEDMVRYFRASVEEKTIEATLSLYLWLQTLGYEPRADDAWWGRWVVKCYMDFVAGRYEARMKYLTAYLQAQHADEWDESVRYPARPAFVPESDKHFLGGSAYTWFSCRITRGVAIEGEDRRLELIQALSGLKKRQPEIPGYKLKSAVDEWIEKIFHTAPVSPPVAVREPVFEALGFVVDEIISVMERSGALKSYVPLPVPSTKARYGPEASRGRGGAFGAFHDYLSAVAIGVNPEELLTQDLAEGRSRRTTRRTSLAVPGGDLACVPVWSVTWSDRTEDGEAGDCVAALRSYFPLAGLATFGRDVGALRVEPTALPEPFKVRMISKGPALTSMRRQVDQKVVHSALQALPEFHLTKERDDRRLPEIVTAAFGQTPLQPEEGYMSGDYTASTDNLSSEVSTLIGRKLAAALGMDDAAEEHFVAGLTGHYYNEGGTYVKQTSGQLMGSETSFPVLCIANLAATLVSLRCSHYNVDWSNPVTFWWRRFKSDGSGRAVDRRAVKLFGNSIYRPAGSSGVVINGDDIAARLTRKEYATWREMMPWFGLAPSMGKNFFSREFVQLNSRMLVPRSLEVEDLVWSTLLANASRGDLAGLYRWLESRPSCSSLGSCVHYKLVPSHSLQVLAPPRAVSFAEACLSLPQWQQTFLDEAVGARRDALNTLFLRTWQPYLSRIPSDLMNWFVPRSLGGFGLETTRPLEMSVRHRHIAAYLRDVQTPESWRDAKMRWADVDVATTVFADQTAALKILEKEGLVRWTQLDHIPEEEHFNGSVLNDSLIWSGYSRPLGERSVQVRVNIDTDTGLGRLGVQRALAPPPAADTTSWFGRTVRRLRKAARGTAREMSVEHVTSYRPRTWGWAVGEGLVMRVERPKVSVATKAVRLPCRAPSETADDAVRSSTPAAPLRAARVADFPFTLFQFQRDSWVEVSDNADEGTLEWLG